MQPYRLHHALQKLSEAILEVENEVTAMKADHDPARIAHLRFTPSLSESHYTKSGKRLEGAAPFYRFRLVGIFKTAVEGEFCLTVP